MTKEEMRTEKSRLMIKLKASGFISNETESDMFNFGFEEAVKLFTIPVVSNHVFCPYCGMKRDYVVTTDINSGKACKNPLCKGK